MDNNINVCTLLIWSLCATGAGIFCLISLGAIDIRHGGIGLIAFTGGLTLFLRRLVLSMRQREDLLMMAGRLLASDEKSSVRHLR